MQAEIKAAIAANKRAIELAEAQDIDQEAMKEALQEVKVSLYEAQTSAFEVVETSGTRAERIRDLEAESKLQDDWAEEAEKYELREVSTNIHAWVAKGTAGYLGKAVKLCPNCFEERRKSVLQHSRVSTSSGLRESVQCARCSLSVGFNGGFLGS